MKWPQGRSNIFHQLSSIFLVFSSPTSKDIHCYTRSHWDFWGLSRHPKSTHQTKPNKPCSPTSKSDGAPSSSQRGLSRPKVIYYQSSFNIWGDMPRLILLSHGFLSQILHKLAHSNSPQFMRLQIDQLDKNTEWSTHNYNLCCFRISIITI